MEEGGGNKLQRFSPKVQGLPVLYHMDGKVLAVGDVLNIDGARLGGVDGHIPQLCQQLRQRSGVVRLVVVQDNIVDALGVANLPDVLEVWLKKAPVADVDKGGFLLPFNQIGIVGGAVIGGHYNIEHPHGGVQGAYLVNPFLNPLHEKILPFCRQSCILWKRRPRALSSPGRRFHFS